MFAGYSSVRTVPRMERFAEVWERIPRALRSSLANGFRAFAPSNDQNRKLAALAHNGGASVHPYFLSRMLFTPEMLSELLPAINANSIVSQRAGKSLIENLSRAQSLDPVNRVSFLEARCYMLNTLLRDSDVMSMAHGLEVRVPLIDHTLARQLMALPGSWKLNAGTPKPLLVHAMRGDLPDQIVHRPKRGFTLPFEHWLRDALRSEIENSLGKFEGGPLYEVISAPAVSRIWADFLSGKTSWSRPWALFVLQRWCEQHSLTC
jgi:asparagine synthase (glutamine-hydrolysing)